MQNVPDAAPIFAIAACLLTCSASGMVRHLCRTPSHHLPSSVSRVMPPDSPPFPCPPTQYYLLMLSQPRTRPAVISLQASLSHGTRLSSGGAKDDDQGGDRLGLSRKISDGTAVAQLRRRNIQRMDSSFAARNASFVSHGAATCSHCPARENTGKMEDCCCGVLCAARWQVLTVTHYG